MINRKEMEMFKKIIVIVMMVCSLASCTTRHIKYTALGAGVVAAGVVASPVIVASAVGKQIDKAGKRGNVSDALKKIPKEERDEVKKLCNNNASCISRASLIKIHDERTEVIKACNRSSYCIAGVTNITTHESRMNFIKVCGRQTSCISNLASLSSDVEAQAIINVCDHNDKQKGQQCIKTAVEIPEHPLRMELVKVCHQNSVCISNLKQIDSSTQRDEVVKSCKGSERCIAAMPSYKHDKKIALIKACHSYDTCLEASSKINDYQERKDIIDACKADSHCIYRLAKVNHEKRLSLLNQCQNDEKCINNLPYQTFTNSRR